MKTIAFIPVRGGSKSIPLKNIKPFCGKPLVCWNIEALENCKDVDEVIVATGSNDLREEKIKMLLAFGIPLATIVHPTALISSSAKNW